MSSTLRLRFFSDTLDLSMSSRFQVWRRSHTMPCVMYAKVALSRRVSQTPRNTLDSSSSTFSSPFEATLERVSKSRSC